MGRGNGLPRNTQETEKSRFQNCDTLSKTSRVEQRASGKRPSAEEAVAPFSEGGEMAGADAFNAVHYCIL